MKKKNIYLLIIILLAVCTIVYVICMKGNDREFTQFLQVYGSINYIEKEDNIITLGVISSQKLDAEPISLATDCNDVEIDNVEVRQGVSYRNKTLYFLNFNLHLSDHSNGDVSISSVVLNGREMGIGKLYFHREEEQNLFGDLQLNACDGAALGEGLKDYHAEIENVTNFDITVENIEIPYYLDADIYYSDTEETKEANLYTKNQVIDAKTDNYLTFDLSEGSINNQAQVYYVSPIITYECNG